MSMAGPASITGSLSAGQQNTTHAQPGANRRRREKPQLSCNICRRRKSRCDRQQPCSTCSARGLLCVYPDGQTSSLMPKLPSTAVPSLQDRLVQLEHLVLSLKPDAVASKNLISTPSSGSTTARRSDDDALTDGLSDCGSMRVLASEVQYVGSDHWVAILDTIADLKDHLDREESLREVEDWDATQDKDGNPKQTRSDHALLLYGCGQTASRAEILAALPPKNAVDRYVSRYFNRLELAGATLHAPTFLRECSQYEAFWTDPSDVSVIWIGLLFTMICIAVLVSDEGDAGHGHEAERQSLQVGLYREKIVQCLVLGKYTRTGPYVLETMIHYLYLEFVFHADANKDVWLLVSISINIAKRMGYHRDPSHFPGISPLEAEMRRRCWSKILMGDLLISSQMGMPRNISEAQFDTAEPRNLNDADLDAETAELPPPRPETEYTTTLNLIARRRMTIALGAVLDLTTSVQPCTHAEVMRADVALHAAAASIPPPLKMKSMAASIADSPQVIMSRLFLRHMLYRGQIMLHRRFLFADPPAGVSSSSPPSTLGDPFAYSRRACIDASLGTLEMQHLMDEETSPGGQLHSMRWRVTSSMNHMFLTSTMILCSLLSRRRAGDREAEILAALRASRAVWMRRSSLGSLEAKKAAETVSIVLARAGEGCANANANANAGEGEGEQLAGIGSDQGLGGITLSNGSDSGIGLDTQKISNEDPVDFLYPEGRFVDPAALLGTLDPDAQQGSSSSFGIMDSVDMGVLDDWTMSAPGPAW
ncbi:fungal-specific transcription factor domain-containing protein [Xylariales sp. PMI_506]|nr:fungal-specific transcription factor domain-containing protein [Xylariales sp. PMI_506]